MRNKLIIAPISNISSLEELILNQENSKILLPNGIIENILKYDSGPESSDRRIIIFSTERNLNILNSSIEIFVDGTFKVCPTLFFQFYTIHAKFIDKIIPLVYALLPAKDTLIYNSFFQI